MGLDAVTNFGYATLAAGISSSATSITLTTGQGARLPSTAFNAVIWDTSYDSPTAAYNASSAEIVRVTARSTDTGTILRAQEGTTARTFNTSGRTYAIAVVLTKGAYDQFAVKVVTGTPMAALAIDLAEDLNTKTVSADTPLSFVATPVVGKVSRLRLSEGGGSNRTITIPSSYSQNRGAAITSFTLNANATIDLVWHYDGTTYYIFNDPLTAAQVKTALAITGSDVSGVSITGGGVSGTWPTLTISGSGSGDVTAASSFATDNRVIRSDGTGKGVQASLVEIDDSGNINVLGDSIPGSLAFADADATAPESVALTAATDITTSYSMVLPAAIGTSGQVVRIASIAGDVATLEFGTVSGSGTVTKVSVVTANGVSGSVATDTSTPAITLTLGAITPSTVNGVTVSGSSTPTLAVTGTTAVSGTNTGDNAVNSNYSGLVSNATHTGDATGATTLTLATVNSNVGSFGSATAAPAVTVNAKGLVTAVTTNTVTPAVGSITGLGTGVATALAVNVGSAGAPVVFNGALGTPSSGTLTSCTIKETFGFALSDESTALTTGLKLSVIWPHASTITSLYTCVTTAPTGATLIVDVKEAGTTILSTKPAIDASEFDSRNGTAAVISDASIASGALVTFHIDQVGASVAGAGLKIFIEATRS